MELTIPKVKFVCIDYPAIVNNADNMLRTLGNEKHISKVINIGQVDRKF
jgi:Tau95 Triple barrel domain